MPLRHIFKIFFLHPEQPPPPFVSPQSSHSRTLLPLSFSIPHKLETFSTGLVVLGRKTTHNAAHHLFQGAKFPSRGLNFPPGIRRPRCRLHQFSAPPLTTSPTPAPGPNSITSQIRCLRPYFHPFTISMIQPHPYYDLHKNFKNKHTIDFS